MARSRLLDPRLPARLRRRFLTTSVTIQQAVDTPDGSGGSTRTWSDLATVKASVSVPKPGDEVVFGEGLQTRVSHRIVIEYLSGVTAKMRVKLGTRILEILEVHDMAEQQALMALDCQERGI